MKSPEEERYEALAEALADLAAKQAEIERRLARLELGIERHEEAGELDPARHASRPAELPGGSEVDSVRREPPGAEPAQAAVPEGLGGPPPPGEWSPIPIPRLAGEPQPQPQDAPDEPGRIDGFQPRELETRMGLTWINRVGVITLILGAAFFFKYAVERHWIGETLRVAMGAAVGAGGLLLADRVWRRGHRIYAQGVCGAAIGILFLSFYAAHELYHVIPQAAAFALMAATTGTAVWMALRFDAMAVAVLGLLGGYLTPLLLRDGGDHPWFFFSYVLLLNLGARWAAMGRKWRGLEGFALGATAWLYLVALRVPTPVERRGVDTLFAVAFYSVFVTLESMPIAAAAQVLAAMAVAVVWSAALAPYVALALLFLAVGLLVADRRTWPGMALVALAAFWMSYARWFPRAEELRPVWVVFPFVTVAFVRVLAWMPERALIRRAVLGTTDLAVMVLNAGLYLGAGYALLQPAYGEFVTLFAVLLAGVHAALAYRFWEQEHRGALLAAGVAWVLLILAAPLEFSGYRITMAWSLEAAAMAWIGVRLGERRATIAALAGFAMVALRLALLDNWIYATAAEYSLLANLRFLTFGVAAFSLWAAAYWLGTGQAALATYVGGHAALLWALGREVCGWAERNAAPENYSSVASTALSILSAGYAVLLVAVGAARESPLNRMLGLGLIGLVVLKLYLYDVWLLGLFYRMAAFAVLGVLLLAMSYLYSHFRVTIERWWQRGRG